MCLKLSMSRKASANLSPLVVPLQQAVDAMLDHPPRRQAGQLVIIGRAEQLVLECLLLADVGRDRQQQVAAADADRAVARQQHLPLLAVADAFLRDRLRGRFAAARRRLRSADRAAPRRRRADPSIPSCAAAASFTSSRRPCSSWTVTPAGSMLEHVLEKAQFRVARAIVCSASLAFDPQTRGGHFLAWSPDCDRVPSSF